MANITWSKSYSSADNGSILGGADIQNIQNDITTVVNGGITNTNISDSAAIVESKIAFNTTTGHDHDGTDSKLISSALKDYISGAELVYVAAETIYATAGVVEINGSVYTRTAVSTTIDVSEDANKVAGTADAASTWFYIYAYNDTGSSWDIKWWNLAPQYSNCGTSTSGTLIYRQSGGAWYRCIGAVRNDASSNILIFYQENDWMYYDTVQAVLTNGTSTTWINVLCTAVVPAFSDLILMEAHLGATSGCITGFRRDLSADATGYTLTSNATGTTIVPLKSASQILEYKNTYGASPDIDLNVVGYYVGAIR